MTTAAATTKITDKDIRENVRIAKINISKMKSADWVGFVIANHETDGYYNCCIENGYEPDGFYESVCLDAVANIYKDKFGDNEEITPEQDKRFDEYFQTNDE